jgi:predicted MFS family arabinose efflux permease
MPTPSPAYRRYVLGTLALTYFLNFLDRGLIGLLLEPIKHDLRLSDTQLGFLTGIAFALFYATLGLPLARWADRGDRVTITSLSLGLWGATMMACLLVSNFVHLVWARIAAAVGEAGSMPPTYSLIGDYFPAPTDRARAMAIYMSASPISSLISFAFGGWLNEVYGWRMTFFVMGVPAIAVALLVRLTVREPRLQSRLPLADKPTPPQMVQVLARLWRQRSSRHLIVAITLLWTLGLGMAPWYGAFLIRTHGMATTELGLWLGAVFSIGGVIGIICGGHVATRWFAGNEGAQMRLSALMIGLLVPCYVLFLLLPQKHQALLALALLVAVFSFFIAPTFSLMQRLVDDSIRATTLAVTLLLANLIGMGLGPQIVGILSDWLTPALQADALRYAMLIVSLFAIWSACHFWLVSRTVADDLAAVVKRTAA